MGAEQDQFEGLIHLLKASSKKSVIEACKRVVSSMCDRSRDDDLTFMQSEFSLNTTEASELSSSLNSILHEAIYRGCESTASVQQLFPPDFHTNLRDLLAKIIVENHRSWRKMMIEEQVSFPKLTKFSWDIKDSPNTASSCVININTSDKSSVDVELSRATLDTMLDSLSRIREQISSIAQ